MLKIFTDGACKNNPGPGGWGALLQFDGREKELFGGETLTTNNRMELTAVIKALESINSNYNGPIEITTDSQYVQKGITEWIKNWKQNNWKSRSKSPVKNQDLWIRLDQLTIGKNISWHWVKGHSGHLENERADELANRYFQ